MCQDSSTLAGCTLQSLVDFPRELPQLISFLMMTSLTHTRSTSTIKDNVNSQVTRQPPSCPTTGARMQFPPVCVQHTQPLHHMNILLASTTTTHSSRSNLVVQQEAPSRIRLLPSCRFPVSLLSSFYSCTASAAFRRSRTCLSF